ncbi:hypothetical protein [Planctomicrobium sp. SH527]|uniref:hypothetical protein n=1 Tax=Planctomicrobium sp. SH527 TaxID=3448123 RepID=UPI003F5B7305
MNRALTLFVVLGLFIGSSGCGGSSGGTVSVWSAQWSDSDSIPGVTAGSVNLVDFAEGSPGSNKFIVWSDLPDGSSRSESSPFSKKYISELKNKQGKLLRIESNSGDSSADGGGIVHVGNQKVQLKSGRVILISTRSETPEILQLEIEPTSELWKIVGQSGEDSDPQTELSIFARSNPKILDFFKGPQATPKSM